MTVDIHKSRQKKLFLNGSRSTDVNAKYQQQQTNNFNSLTFLNSQITTLKSRSVHRINSRQG